MLRSAIAVIPLATLAALKLVLHLASHHRYGYERDELYFIACAKRLAWGYIDHPPFVPLIARLSGAVFDDSLFGLRLFPILALTAALLLTLNSKVYYLAPAFPMLLAAGAVATERWLAQMKARWLRLAIPGLLAVGGLVFLPLLQFMWVSGGADPA